jgi:hypothetical protein
MRFPVPPHVMTMPSAGFIVTGSVEAPVDATRRPRHGLALGLAALLTGIVCALAPSPAAAAACPSTDEADMKYTGNCGPWFVVPSWSDAGGWNDPSQYATIQLADVNGDGKDELIGRGDVGIQIYRFDTTLGQWRPQVDAKNLPQMLPDFASPPTWQESDPHSPAQPQYYSTIQAADIDGQPGEEILARFWDGMRVYKYTPSQGNQIDGGSWSRIGTAGPFSDGDGWGDPSLYLTIKTADTDGNGQAELLSRTPSGAAIYHWVGSVWEAERHQVTSPLFGGNCGDVRCYSAFRPFAALGAGVAGYDYLLTRPGGGAGANQQGVQMLKPPAEETDRIGWTGPLPTPQSPQDPTAAPFNSQSSWPDCVPGGGNTECFDQSPSYYETLRAADIDGWPGDELLGRLDDGLRAKRYGLGGPPDVVDDTELQFQGCGQPDDPCSDGQQPDWTHASGVPGAIQGTESSAPTFATAFWQGDSHEQIVQVIGPKGPGLGRLQLDISLGDGSGLDVTINQQGPRRIEQQVLYTFASSGSPQIQFSSMFGGTIDAIRVSEFAESGWRSLATLRDLAGTSQQWASTPGKWGSIRTANIDGQGGDEVLALDGTGLQAWSYDGSADAWTKLQPTTPLALGADPWLSHPEYYSTIQTGDVDGDGRDDVIARGPSGIRTWFYDRRGTSGGWERYLPEGYQGFANDAQNDWFSQLTTVAHQNGVLADRYSSVREVWATETAPDSDDLDRLEDGLIRIGNCSGASTTEPVSFQACTPPGSKAPDPDWTAVINAVLAEIHAAGEVVDFFGDLKGVQQSVFILENAELPAIGDKLGLQAASGSQAQFNPQELWSLVFGIGGELSFLGDVTVPLGVALSITSEVLSATVSASPTAMASPFQSTYAGLKDDFAHMVSEASTAHDVQSQQVREDAGLLGLVGQLRSSGTWAVNSDGMTSAAQQGFATWVYKALMPTLYDRYQIQNCNNRALDEVHNLTCTGVPAGAGVIGGGENFTTIAGQYNGEDKGVPCGPWQIGFGTETIPCTFPVPPQDLMNRIWGPPNCIYKPDNESDSAATEWTFGCSAGVDVNTSIGANTWNFPVRWGAPEPFGPNGRGDEGSAAAAQLRLRRPIVLGRPRLGNRRAVRGSAQVSANVAIPHDLRLSGATLRLNRALFERRGRGELTLPRGKRRPRPLGLRLRRVGSGRFTAAKKGRRRVRIALRRVSRAGSARLTLGLGGAAFRAPRVCHALPASDALDTPPLQLESRLVISDGRTRHRIRLTQHVRCVRDRRGNVHRLEPVRFRAYPARPGLAVTLRGPRRVQPGTAARYVARVHNRRRGTRRLASSLWHVTLNNRARPRRIKELRRGRSRRLVFMRRVPRSARRRFCVDVLASAAGARAARARVCSRVQGARPPRATG